MSGLGRNEPCWCGSGKKYKKCHADFDEKREALAAAGHVVPPNELIKLPHQIEGIRKSAKVNIAVLDYVAAHIRAGISTAEIDRWVYEETLRMGGVPAPLGFEGFPKSVCTSVNNQVCHGIPSDDMILQDGDIINVDVSTIVDGYYSDSSRMFCIGSVLPEWEKLVRVAKECVEKGLEQVKPWGFLGDIGQAVNDHAKANGYSVVREIGGHGVGLAFHEDPWVSYTSQAGTGMVLAPGLMFTIEPMVNMGSAKIFQDSDNGWTIYTDDELPSAQWEIQVLVTEDGYEVIAY
nr:methionyl aminopeptidase [uncultured Butyricicoccus sp.]